MSLVSERQKTHDFLMPIICWRCDAPMMKIKSITPALLSPSLDEVVYSCPACHDERKRTVMRAD